MMSNLNKKRLNVKLAFTFLFLFLIINQAFCLEKQLPFSPTYIKSFQDKIAVTGDNEVYIFGKPNLDVYSYKVLESQITAKPYSQYSTLYIPTRDKVVVLNQLLKEMGEIEIENVIAIDNFEQNNENVIYLITTDNVYKYYKAFSGEKINFALIRNLTDKEGIYRFTDAYKVYGKNLYIFGPDKLYKINLNEMKVENTLNLSVHPKNAFEIKNALLYFADGSGAIWRANKNLNYVKKIGFVDGEVYEIKDTSQGLFLASSQGIYKITSQGIKKVGGEEEAYTGIEELDNLILFIGASNVYVYKQGNISIEKSIEDNIVGYEIVRGASGKGIYLITEKRRTIYIPYYELQHGCYIFYPKEYQHVGYVEIPIKAIGNNLEININNKGWRSMENAGSIEIYFLDPNN